MNHEKEQADLLAPLRALPTEVDLDQVAHMVAVFPLTPEPTSWLSTLSNNLNILIMTTSTLLIGLGLYLFGGNTQQAHTPPPVPPVEVIVPLIDSVPSTPVPVVSTTVPLPAAVPTAQVPAPTAPVQMSTPPLFPEPMPYDSSITVVDVPADWKPAPMSPGLNKPGERNFPVKNYRAVEVMGNLNVTVEAGDFGVTANGEDEVLDRLNVKVEGDRLRLYVQDKSETKTKKGLFGGTKTTTVSGSCGGENLNITVRIPVLDRAQVQGSGTIRLGNLEAAKELDLRVQGSGLIKADGAIATNNLTVRVQGSGKVECTQIAVVVHADISVQGSGQVNCKQVGTTGRTSISVQGSGRARVSGDTEELSVSLKGSGNVQASELSARKSSVELMGSGNVHVKESANLTVQSAGSGKVRTGN